MTALEAIIFTLASAIILGAGIAVLYTRWFGRELGNWLIWLIIVVMASTELLAMCSAIRPCTTEDTMRRCDLEAPNPVKQACGLLVHPFRPC